MTAVELATPTTRIDALPEVRLRCNMGLLLSSANFRCHCPILNLQLGLHFHVSCVAVPDEAAGLPPSLSQALHVLLTQGLFVHAATGTVLMLDPR